MTQFIGKIKEIYTEEIFKQKSGIKVQKEVLILGMSQGQTVSIQFQAHYRDLLKNYREGQEVIIDVVFNGRRTSKRFYDNILGKNIVKLN